MPKISALPAGTTPDGTEKIPAVQGGATVELALSQILAPFTPNAPFVILAMGQSNFTTAPAFSSSLNSASKKWNNTLGSVSTGTAYVPLSGTTITLPEKFASDIADANPGRSVRLINSSFSGMPISHWLSGTGAPDAYQDAVNNMVPALAACGATKVDLVIWWQGESDTLPINQSYPANFETMMGRFWGNSWFPRETPVLVYGIASKATSLNADADNFNSVLKGVVNADPDNRRFVYTPTLQPDATYWDPNPTFLRRHMTGQGYFSAGAMGAREYLRGVGQASDRSIITQPATGNVVVGLPAYSTAPALFNRGTGLNPPAPAIGTVWQFEAPDGQTSYATLNSYGGIGGYVVRRGNGTQAAPTQLLLDDIIVIFGAQGYDNAGVVLDNKAALVLRAAENWVNPNNHGTYGDISLTPIGSDTGAVAVRFYNGSMKFFGTTSGTGTMSWPAALGTPAWVLPTNSGTFAVSATAPLFIDAATGNATFVFTGLTAAAAAADADTIIVNQGAGNLKQTFTAVKTWIKSWIAKADVGLGSVPNTDCTNAANISSGTLPAGRLPNPTASTLGGVESYAAVSNQWINTISTSGVPSSTQPAMANISDYSTGSWTPVLTFATPGNLSVSYALQDASYTKVGNRVICNFVIVTSAFTFTTASGNILITGLPFTSSNASANARWYAPIAFQGITKVGYTSFVGALVPNTTQMLVVGSGSGVAASNVTSADTPTGGTMILAGEIQYNV